MSKFKNDKLANQKIMITTDGKTTTAVLYNGKQRIKEAKSICASNDEFNFEYGASLAFDRLTGFIRGKVDSTLEEKSDWNKFLDGEVTFEVAKNDINKFLEKCAESNLMWRKDIRANEWNNYDIWKNYLTIQFKRWSDGYITWSDRHHKNETYVRWNNDSLDWDKFIEGKLEVKVSREKFDDFIKQCNERDLMWRSFNNTVIQMNPWKVYNRMSGFMKAIVEIAGDNPKEYLYILFDKSCDSLRWSNNPQEDVDEYEFV